jgi:acylglycerol lipase
VGLVFITHGVNEHVSRYMGVAHRLTAAGYALVGHDHLGHGGSAGHRGDVVDFNYLTSDMKQLMRSQMALYPGLPIFILGEWRDPSSDLKAFRSSCAESFATGDGGRSQQGTAWGPSWPSTWRTS